MEIFMNILGAVAKGCAVWFVLAFGILTSCWPINDKPVPKPFMFVGITITLIICYFIVTF